MFIEQRHQEILDMLEVHGSVTTKEVAEAFKISIDSAKRDLRMLEEKGFLKRTYGGAVPLGELAIGRPKSRHAVCADTADPRVTAMAQTALTLAEPTELVFVSGGDIGVEMARMLPADKKLRAVTNSVRVAEALYRRGISCIMTGGTVNEDGSCYDSFAAEIIRRLRIGCAFITTDGISPNFGLSLSDPGTIPFVSALIDASRTVIGVYPAEKFRSEGAFSLCPVTRLDTVVTDADASVAEPISKMGIKVISSKKTV